LPRHRFSPSIGEGPVQWKLVVGRRFLSADKVTDLKKGKTGLNIEISAFEQLNKEYGVSLILNSTAKETAIAISKVDETT
jgi:hypothetical protein